MSSISGRDSYNAALRKRIHEYHEQEASRNSPVMILDSPRRSGHIQSGNTPYSCEGGRSHTVKKKGFAKFMRNVGEYIKPVAQPLLQAATRRGVQAIEGAGGREDWMSEVRDYSIKHNVGWQEAILAASAARKSPFFKYKARPVLKVDEPKKTRLKRNAKHVAKVDDEEDFDFFDEPKKSPRKKSTKSKPQSRQDWLDDIRAYSRKHEVPWKEAMMSLSAERHRQNGTKPKPKRTEAQKAATKAKRAAKKSALVNEPSKWL